jgi:MUN domain
VGSVSFAFQIEGHLQSFVWRWIKATDEKIVGWVEGAVKNDTFQMGSHPGADQDEERHSVSAVDIFQSFKQSKDQIIELDWDVKYQHAKFMTGISKSIGMGIARYCDLIEQKFAKEMDRLSPEQEASLNKSRQEKWMQMAKDAWTNKEVVEPFQFLAEVCTGG